MRFEIIEGHLARQTAHALVNTTGSDVRMECGVSNDLGRAVDGPIADEVAKQKPLCRGDVVVTDAYDLPAV